MRFVEFEIGAKCEWGGFWGEVGEVFGGFGGCEFVVEAGELCGGASGSALGEHAESNIISLKSSSQSSSILFYSSI